MARKTNRQLWRCMVKEAEPAWGVCKMREDIPTIQAPRSGFVPSLVDGLVGFEKLLGFRMTGAKMAAEEREFDETLSRCYKTSALCIQGWLGESANKRASTSREGITVKEGW